jgi:hypothetical protein
MEYIKRGFCSFSVARAKFGSSFGKDFIALRQNAKWTCTARQAICDRISPRCIPIIDEYHRAYKRYPVSAKPDSACRCESDVPIFIMPYLGKTDFCTDRWFLVHPVVSFGNHLGDRQHHQSRCKPANHARRQKHVAPMVFNSCPSSMNGPVKARMFLFFFDEQLDGSKVDPRGS